jgi:hypothetical protein
LTKHQKLSLVRTYSNFSFEDLTKLNIKEMTYYRKRTASERELIVKTLRNSSLGKRKPRRAIRRKPQKTNTGAELTVAEIETGVGGSPNVKSAAESICGDSVCGGVSVIGGSGDGDPMVRGSVDHLKQSSPLPRLSSSEKGCLATAGVRAKTHRVKIASGSGGSVINLTKPMGSGGKRVRGRVKTVSDKDRNRFILETNEEEASKFGTTILSILGKSPNVGEEMLKLKELTHFGLKPGEKISPEDPELEPSTLQIASSNGNLPAFAQH